ncbi:energy transducer TonB [Pseudoxanthomonas sp. Root65]|uniref:energy transducer TonB n=1 Tax=Pseudoxanthomonas sp. Root65 TaxID=1736576 RepID=UPI0009E71A50|nr:energy transducer TonB [Pseudoxanthomonas sp. Root65]
MKTMWMWMGVGIALGMTACGDAAAPAASREEAVAIDVATGDEPATPYERATRALSAGRMLSPVGDNAVEHYLAARTQAPEQARAQAALAELQPYVLIAAEQAIARGDAPEALRLQGLIERIDARAPALPRLRTAVAALVREQAARELAVAQEAVQPLASAPVASTPALPPPAVVPMTATAAPQADPVSTPVVPTAAQEPPRPVSTPQPAARIAQGTTTPRLLQDAQPRYPLPALRARIEGQAEVAFTIQPDGSVRDVRLLSSTADGMFDASALAVAQRWRFEATGQAHASSRTVRFRLPAGEARGG